MEKKLRGHPCVLTAGETLVLDAKRKPCAESQEQPYAGTSAMCEVFFFFDKKPLPVNLSEAESQENDCEQKRKEGNKLEFER